MILFTLSQSAFAERKYLETVPQDAILRIEKNLNWLSSLKSNQLSEKFIERFDCGENALGQCLFHFINRHIETIGFNASPVPAQAFMLTHPWIPRTLWLTPNYLKHDTSRLTEILALVHEADHFSRDTRHALCPQTFTDANGEPYRSSISGIELAGLPGCDSDSSGTYATEIIAALDIEKYCTNCDADDLAEARRIAGDLLPRILEKFY